MVYCAVAAAAAAAAGGVLCCAVLCSGCNVSRSAGEHSYSVLVGGKKIPFSLFLIPYESLDLGPATCGG